MSLAQASQSPDELVRRYIELVRPDLEPDPLYRRRLRGVVTNRFVAAREGIAEPVRRPTQTGKLGRACLYASFALAMSVGGALAASRGALPGDLLYPMKLQVEAIRLEAFPQQFHDDLLVYALTERTAELDRLVEEGRLESAGQLVETIRNGYQEVAELGVEGDSEELGPSLAVLDAVSDRLPAPAQAAIDRAMNQAAGANGSAGGRHPAPAAEAGRPHGHPAPVSAGHPPIEAPHAAENASHRSAEAASHGKALALPGSRGRGNSGGPKSDDATNEPPTD
ncbi:MAG TPA: DUF5667 domain-containing protein [Candidatus Limnocylindria bacterium]|nr:DUF5667 domain-containing protein [Candidatus Limnocylindria bacterium]